MADERRGAWLIGWIDISTRTIRRVGIFNSPPSLMRVDFSSERCVELAYVAGEFDEALPKLLSTLASGWEDWCLPVMDVADREAIETLRRGRVGGT